MDIITIILIVVTCIILGLGFSVIHMSREKLNRLYFLNIVTIIGWAVSMIYYRISSDNDIVLWTKLLYVAASLIASNFLYFTYAFPETNYIISNIKKFFIFLPNIILIFFIVNGDWIITGAKVNHAGENFIYWGSLYPIYVVYILFYFNFAFSRLIIKFRKTNNHTEKIQLGYVIVGYMSSGLISFTTNLILPSFGYFALNWVGQVSTILMAISATFAIIKHRLFNARVIATELLVFILWIILLIQTMIANNATDIITNGAILVITFFIGIFLIRSVTREIAQRERIEILANSLKSVNNILSHDIKGVLGKNRSIFAEMLLGTFGTISDETKNLLKQLSNDTDKVLESVLAILDAGQEIKLNLEKFDLKALLLDVIWSVKTDADKKSLSMDVKVDDTTDFTILGDKKQLSTHVIKNLIENAINYTPTGTIAISLIKKDEKTIQLSVKDTGVGITPEDKERLFKEGGHGVNSIKINVHSTGYGLFIAKKITDAHKGKIWVESEGAGKGSTFFVELLVG